MLLVNLPETAGATLDMLLMIGVLRGVVAFALEDLFV